MNLSLTLSDALRNLGENWADLPPVADALLRISIILSIAWLMHVMLLKSHSAWRVLLWRGVVVGILLLPLPGLFIPRLAISLPAESHSAGGSAVELPSLESNVIPEAQGFGASITQSSSDTETFEATSSSVSTSDSGTATNPVVSSWSLLAYQAFLTLLESLPGILFTLWGLGVLILSLRWLRGQLEVRKLISTCHSASENSLRILREIEEQNGSSSSVQLMVSSDQEIPFAAGIRRGVIVVPERLCSEDQVEELRGVLAHELSHHQSGDLRWMGMLQGLEILLWFHPLVWRVQTAHAMACEERADTQAARSTGGLATYSKILARAALRYQRPLPSGAVPMAATSEIFLRLQRLERGIGWLPPDRRKLSIALMVGLVFVVGIAGFQFVRAADVPLDGSGRILSFPEDRSIGNVMYALSPKEKWEEYQTQPTCMTYWSWQELGSARGKVSIPEGAIVKLVLSATGANDPSWVHGLKPDDIYEIEINGFAPGFQCGDREIEQLCELSGLKALKVYEISFTDRAAKSLERLRDLQVFHSRKIQLTNQGLKSIARLTTLESLILSLEKIPGLDDTGLAELAPLTSLRELNIHSLAIQGPGLKHLARLPNLVIFNAGGETTTDRYLEALRHVKQLKTIRIPGSLITDDGLKYLVELPELETLDVRRCRELTNGGMQHVKKMRSLRYLDLSLDFVMLPKNYITQEGVCELTGLPSMTELILNNIPMNDEGCRKISELRNLKHLWINGGDLTDVGLAHLSKLTELEHLELVNTKITDAGLESLLAFRKLQHLHLGTTIPISDTGLETLAKLSNLQVLFLPYHQSPQMTTAGISKFNALPELRVLSASSSLKDDPTAPPMNLSNLKQLRQLYLSPLRDDDLISIANLPKLEWLLFGGDTISDKGLSYLSNLKTLTRLQLGQANLPTDACIDHFQGLDKLFELTLNGKFTDAGLEGIGNLKSIQVLNLISYGKSFSPTAKQKLYDNLPNLKRASIEDARVKRGKPRKPGNVVRKAPDFSVKTLNGNTLTRDDFKGKVLLLYFWFTSCKPCVASTPEVKKSYENVTREFPDFRMISLSTDSYDALVQQHVDKHELSWPQARIGPESKLQAEFGVEGFPHFVVIDREGNVRYNGSSGDQLDESLRTALEEKKGKK